MSETTDEQHIDHQFVEQIDMSAITQPQRDNINPTIIDTICAHLSIALGISYYKLAPTPSISIPFTLTATQQAFWQQFYLQGLGEFFYTNNLDPTGYCQIACDPETTLPGPFVIDRRNRPLIPVGGGKDSCVTIERYRARDRDFDLFSFGKSYPVHEDIARIAEKPRLFVARHLDPLLFDLNDTPGYRNGHVPITGIISFVSLLVSYLYDYDEVVMSNERSADYGNLIRHGHTINHQYSKSQAYETAFGQYVRETLTSDRHYHSELGDIMDADVAREMTAHRHYFGHFSSCNRNFHIQIETHDDLKKNNNSCETLSAGSGRRCKQCPKCLFTYATMRPYITHDDVCTIWGTELYDDVSLLPLFRELIGDDDHIKPFECVGTPEEMHSALAALLDAPDMAGYPSPEMAPLLQRYRTWRTVTPDHDTS